MWRKCRKTFEITVKKEIEIATKNAWNSENPCVSFLLVLFNLKLALHNFNRFNVLRT